MAFPDGEPCLAFETPFGEAFGDAALLGWFVPERRLRFLPSTDGPPSSWGFSPISPTGVFRIVRLSANWYDSREAIVRWLHGRLRWRSRALRRRDQS